MVSSLGNEPSPGVTSAGDGHGHGPLAGLWQLWSRRSTAVTAALLNASGLGLGYAYLRRGRDAAVYWVGLLVWWWLASNTGFWLVVLLAWVVVAVVRAARAGADPAAAGARPVLAARRPWLPAAAGLVLLAAVAAAVLAYRAGAWHQLDAGDEAHAQGRCEAAVDRYGRASGRYELSFTRAVDRAEGQARVCRQLLEARRLAADESFPPAIEGYLS